MLGVLPLLSLVALILLSGIILLKRQPETDWRQPVLLGSITWGIWLTLATEALSLFDLFQFEAIVATWVLPAMLWLWLIPHLPSRFQGIRIRPMAFLDSFFLAGISLILAVTGLIAVISPPNNWDSLIYHLTRVMHWVQNQSVAHYATHEIKQLYQSPWAEYAIAHVYILTGGDQLVNLVQWLSMAGCVVGTSLLARQLGLNFRGQVVTALVTATIPMGLLQAVTTQNDYVVAFWLLCFVSFVLAVRQDTAWPYILGAAGSLGLAVLTKPTAYVFGAPFFLGLAWFQWQHRSWQAWKTMAIIGAFVVLINSGHYLQNYLLFDSPLQPQSLGQYGYKNEIFGPGVVVSNLVRNVALHVNVLPETLRTELQGSIASLHRLLGLDISDPRTTWWGTTFAVNGFVIHEDVSGNFVHFALFLAGSAMLVFAWRQRSVRLLVTHTAGLIVAFILFSAYLKWQPWHSRLQLPLFVLGAPLIGWLLGQLPFRPWLANGLALLLVGQALPFILTNPLHPVLGQPNIFKQDRVQQYFVHRPILAESYQATAARILEEKCDRVGLILPNDTWEYPFWVLLNQPAAGPVQIRAVNVKNESSVLEPVDFRPCAVICLQCPEDARALYTAQMGPPLAGGRHLLFLTSAPIP